MGEKDLQLQCADTGILRQHYSMNSFGPEWACKSLYPGSIPGEASNFLNHLAIGA